MKCPQHWYTVGDVLNALYNFQIIDSLKYFYLGKRGLPDLKNDSLLSKVFAGDVKEEEKKVRTDRSINIEDEQETNLKRTQAAYFMNSLNSLYSTDGGKKMDERRAVDPSQEALYNSAFMNPGVINTRPILSLRHLKQKKNSGGN